MAEQPRFDRPARGRWIFALKVLLFAAVLLAVGRHAASTWLDFQAKNTQPRFSLAWLVVAGVVYLAGLVLDGIWFGRVLDQSTSRVPRRDAIAAYLISHLGKYVPGKAMVVVMRVGLIVPAGARASTATLATIYETLVMMAAGGLVAALGFALAPARAVPVAVGSWKTAPVPLALLGLALGCAFLLTTAPIVFAWLTRTITRPFRGIELDVMPRLSIALLGEGLAWTALGWLLLGASQLAVLTALGWNTPGPALPAVLASVALATVAGFAVPIAPGGLGVREWVLWTSLGTVLSHDRAVLAALLLRLVWVIAEVLAASVLLLWRRNLRQRLAPRQAPAP